MLAGYGLQRMLLEQEVLIAVVVLLGLYWLREKTRRLIMGSAGSVHTPAYNDGCPFLQ